METRLRSGNCGGRTYKNGILRNIYVCEIKHVDFYLFNLSLKRFVAAAYSKFRIYNPAC